MKKLIAAILATLLVVSLIPFSTVAAAPDYAVSLKATEEKVYEGDTVEISFVINSEEFIITDMKLGYETAKFTYPSNTTGVVKFPIPELFDQTRADGDGEYELQTKFTFTANEVADTVEAEFTVEAADIVHSYDDANNESDTNISNRTGVKVTIVKQYDVIFKEANGNILSEQKIDKGLGTAEDTAISVPTVSYDDYVDDGLVADYYEHVWVYNGTEYTDAEVAAFGKAGSADEITEDTEFELLVREQTFDVTVPAESFDTNVTKDTATYGEDYSGKINPTEYDDKYIYTVKYEIDGVEKSVDCTDDSFTIPGANITGDMTLSLEKVLGIEINAYPDYITGHYLITVRGNAVGYTFNGHEMYESATHNNLRAWIYKPAGTTSVAQAIEYAESVIFVSDVASPFSPKGCDLNESGSINLNDPALAHGGYMAALNPVEDWVKVYLTADVDVSYCVDTDDYDMVVEAYEAR